MKLIEEARPMAPSLSRGMAFVYILELRSSALYVGCSTDYEARLRDHEAGKGVIALTKIPHLAELGIDLPPLTDAALKALARCKELKTINIGKDAPPETEPKPRQALPVVVVNRATE